MTRFPFQLGRYTVLERLGGGGMGDVYRAELPGAEGFRRACALKVMRSGSGSDPKLLKMFLREAKAMAAFRHRGVVQVMELESVDGQIVLAMELLHGVDLAVYTTERKLPWPALAYVAAEAFDALAAVHSLRTSEIPAGLIHGDLTPSNIMLCADGAVKLLDFGLARAQGSESTTGTRGGKISYLAPESLGGLPLDARIDTYSLGVSLYEAGSGVRLFRGANDLGTINMILRGPEQPLTALLPDAPPALTAAIDRAMARDRDRRPSDTRELADLLARIPREGFGPSDLARLLAERGAPVSVDAADREGQAPTRSESTGRRTEPDPTATASSPHEGPHARQDRRRRLNTWVAVAAAGVGAGVVAVLSGPAPPASTLQPSPPTYVVEVRARMVEATPAPAPEVVRPTPGADASPSPARRPQRPPTKKTVSRVDPRLPAKSAVPANNGTPERLAPGYIADPFKPH